MLTLLSQKTSNALQIVVYEILILQITIGSGNTIPKDQEEGLIFNSLIFYYENGNSNTSHSLRRQKCRGSWNSWEVAVCSQRRDFFPIVSL